MNIIIVTCLLTLSVLGVNNVCKNSEDFAELYSQFLEAHKSLFALIESRISSESSDFKSTSFFKLMLDNKPYNAIIRVEEAHENQHKLLESALFEAAIVKEFVEIEDAQFGYLSPTFIDCEYGTAFSRIKKTTYNYVIILTDYLPTTFDIFHKPEHSLMTKMSEKTPLERLIVYFKIARSLESTHRLAILHGQIEPKNIASDLELTTPKIIEYSKSTLISEEAEKKLDKEFDDAAISTDLELKDAGNDIDPTIVNAEFFIPDVRALILSFSQIECAISNTQPSKNSLIYFNYRALYEGQKDFPDIIKATESLNDCFERSKISQLEGFQHLLNNMMQSFNEITQERRYSSSKLATELLIAIRKNNNEYTEPFYLNGDSGKNPINYFDEVKEEDTLLVKIKIQKII